MSSPFKTEAIEVVSGGAADPRIVAGTADPTIGFTGPEGSVYLRYGAGVGRIYVKTGPLSTNWDQAVVGAGGGGTLDTSYDFGGAGAGRIITADSGAVQVDATTTNTQAALTVNRTPGGAAAAVGIALSLGANFNASGVGLSIADAGAGSSVNVAKSNSGSALRVDLTNLGAKALEVVVTAAPTSASPVSIVANTTGTTADLLSISKIPGAGTAGNALSVSMGANTSGAGLYVSNAGSGAAIEVAAGSIDFAGTATTSSTTRARLVGRQWRMLQGVGEESNSGMFDNGTFTAGTLSIVGNGTIAGQRRVRIWEQLQVGVDTGSAAGGIIMQQGSAFPVSGGSSGRIRYNESTNKLQISENGGTYVNIATGSSMAIGASITSATAGSVLFAGAAGVLAQDNANFFWDDTNNRLGIGVAAPTHTLHVVGNSTSHLVTVRNTNAIGFSAWDFLDEAGVGQMGLGVNNGSNLTYISFQQDCWMGPSAANGVFFVGGNIHFGGTANPAVKTRITGALQVTATAFGAAIPTFETGAAGQLTLVHASGNWGVVSLRAAADTGAAHFTLFKTRSTDPSVKTAVINGDLLGDLNWQSPDSGGTVFRSAMIEARVTGVVGASSIPTDLVFYTTATATLAERMRITSAGEVRIPALTTGSVLFAGASGAILQDNANFFWDDTNNRLSLGGGTATNTLLVQNAAAGAGVMSVRSTSASGLSTCSYHRSSDNAEMLTFGYANASAGGSYAGFNFFYSIADIVISPDAVTNTHRFGAAANSVFHEMTSGGSAASSATNTGRLRYNSTGQVFQISKNTGGYETLASLDTAQTYTKSQNVARVALTDAVNIATDASLGNVFSVTLADNRTLDNPTNLVDGGTYYWIVTQDGTGSRTLAYGALFKWPGGVVPVLSTAIGAVDLITAVYNGTILAASINKAFA